MVVVDVVGMPEGSHLVEPLVLDGPAAVSEADYHQAMNEIELQQPPLSNTPIPVDDWPTPTARELADQLFRVPTLDNSV